jgi:hypothetical protein
VAGEGDAPAGQAVVSEFRELCQEIWAGHQPVSVEGEDLFAGSVFSWAEGVREGGACQVPAAAVHGAADIDDVREVRVVEVSFRFTTTVAIEVPSDSSLSANQGLATTPRGGCAPVRSPHDGSGSKLSVLGANPLIMKVLVATSKTQGDREGDFHWCVEGELVWVGLVCAADRRDSGRGCGCGRSFSGMNSHRATTTAMVKDLKEFSRADYVEAFRSSLAEQGWRSEIAGPEADRLLELADFWPAGTVVERHLDTIAVRMIRT